MSESPFVGSIHDAGSGPDNGASTASNTAAPSYSSTQTTVVELLSTSATSSAFPESFGLSVSIKGRWIVAYSSSALYILSVRHLPAFQNSCRAFRVRRKPLAVAITDMGKFAVLTTSHKIDVYQCGEEQGNLLSGQCRKQETIFLNNEARTVAFSYCGEVVAAGSDVGIEIRNLSPGSVETDKRQINCAAVEFLSFSENGKSLLATTAARRTRVSTFISVNSAYEDALLEDNPITQPIGKVWITQLLFPERINARQAVFLPDAAGGSVNEVLAFDSHADRYSIWDITMKRFAGQKLAPPKDLRWSRSERFDDALPAVSCDGSHAALAVRFKGKKEVWTYHLAPDWRERATDSNMGSEEAFNNDDISPLQRIQLPSKDEGASPENITCLRWMEYNDAPIERLVVLISSATHSMPEDVVPSAAPAASGKIMLFDFRRTIPESNEESPETVIVDLDGIPITEGLADEVLELDREVDIVRRRTQVQRQRPDLSTRTNSSGSRTPRRSASSGSTTTLTRDASGSRSARRRRSFSSISSAGEGEDFGPITAVDEPYSQSQPRSQFSLNRAATMAANAPANRAHLRALPTRPLEYRRADGLREMPHESDADNWVPPPPPYTAEPDNTVSLPITSNPQAAAPYQPQPRARNQAPLSAATAPPASRPIAASRSAATPASAIAPVPVSIFNVPPPMSRTQTTTSVLPVPAVPVQLTPLIPRRPVASDIPLRSPLAPPMPGYLNSPMTFPPRSNSPGRVGPAALHMRTTSHPPSNSQSLPNSPATRIDGRDMPSPISHPPSSERTSGLHQRSESGGSIPRSAFGTVSTTPADLMRALPPAPGHQRPTSQIISPTNHHRNSSMIRENSRPALSRLATIDSNEISNNRHQTPHSSTNTTPETPGPRRQWWRIGGGREHPTRPPTAQSIHRAPQTRSTTPAPGRGKEKEGGMKCIVM
ncbi:hypothetical protein EJ08DRAFT_52224 [Tothia fuscella]|uniref:DUF7165 domain-containing protein n=1 Tax=Tothia fuscella TaxID=1048955 RepID=A0A9P4TSX0_9PEZI|nr:hypothetical protein EJ08DRAFT_52224 [Tothia fuscella]